MRLKQLFCKHTFRWITKHEKNPCGENQMLMCTKCGKIAKKRFIKYGEDKQVTQEKNF